MAKILKLEMPILTKAEGFLVRLWWHGDQAWGLRLIPTAYTFRCLGSNWGPDRWVLDLAEADQDAPKMSRTEAAGLLTALTNALREAIRINGNHRQVGRVTSDKILWPSDVSARGRARE